MNSQLTCKYCRDDITMGDRCEKCAVSVANDGTYEAVCDHCGTRFTRNKKHPGGRYCTRACFGEHRKLEDVDGVCVGCGVTFKKRDSSDKRFCTSRCANAYHRQPNPSKKQIAKCVVCGTTFESWAYRKSICCSRKCASSLSVGIAKPTARRPDSFVTKTCAYCGVEYARHKIYHTGGRTSSFCSIKCRAEQRSIDMKGERNHNWVDSGHKTVDRGDNWLRQARLVRKRDNYTCQDCGKVREARTELFDVHHIVPYRLFNGDYKKANELSNLVYLCRKCHVLADNEFRKREKQNK
jgi:hypothetical protein